MWEEGKGEQSGPREQTILAMVFDIDRSIEEGTSKRATSIAARSKNHATFTRLIVIPSFLSFLLNSYTSPVISQDPLFQTPSLKTFVFPSAKSSKFCPSTLNPIQSSCLFAPRLS